MMSIIFGCAARGKVLDVFLESHEPDLARTEIEKKAKIGPDAVDASLKMLIMYGIVVESRMVSNQMMYKLNRDSPAAMAFLIANENLRNTHLAVYRQDACEEASGLS